jgi:flagellar motor switch protein FliG
VNDTSTSGIQRVAAFLLSLEEEKVAAVLKHLADDVVEQVARAMMELDSGMDSSTAIDSLYRELAVRANLPKAVRPCTEGELEQLLARSHGGDRARSLVADIQARLHRDRPFRALEAYPEVNIAKVLSGEPPAVVALIASQITPSVTAGVLEHFEPEKATETLRRMASVKTPPPTVLIALAEDLEAQLKAMAEQPAEIGEEDRLRGIAEILSYSSPELETGVVESLQAVDEESATALREFLFTWEDISAVDKRSMQKILGTVDTKTLSLALKGCGQEVEESVMSNLSERVRDMVAEERELAGAVPRNEVEMAREDILKNIRAMIESGEFRPARSGEDLVA